MAFADYLYPTRSSELPIIKRNRVQFFKDIVGEDDSDQIKDFELTTTEFTMIATLFQMNLNYLVNFIDLAMEYGGIFVSFSYIILQGCLGMPLFMLYTFMGAYSKKSYLKFWDCVPILEGLGITIALIRFASEFYNVSGAALCLTMIPHLFQNWRMDEMYTCNHGKQLDSCIPMYPQENFTKNCSALSARIFNQSIFFSTQYYLRRDIMEYNSRNLDCCTVNMKWYRTTVIVWIILFSCSIFGISRVRKITVNMQFLFGGLLCCISFYSLSFSSPSEESTSVFTNTGFSSANQFGFWVDLILHSGETSVLGNMIWLGTIKPKTLTPRHAALIVSPLKLLLFILAVCWSSRIVKEVIISYKIMNPSCINVSGHELIFAFIPDVLHRLFFGKFIVMMWFLGIFFFAVMSPLYSLIGLVDSITEKYKNLSKYRLYVYLVICVTGALLNVPMSSNISLALIYTYKNYGLPLLSTTILLLVNLALMFIYSTKRIVDDYNFTFGSPPHKYWITFWRTSPIFSLFAFIFMITQIKTQANIHTRYEMVVFSYVQCSLMLSPVIVTFLTKCCRHVKYRTLGSLSRPSRNWGPYNHIKRQARKYFYPQRDVKYRNYVLQCMHKCIANSGKYYEEKRRQNHKLHMLTKEMDNITNEWEPSLFMGEIQKKFTFKDE